MRKLQSVLVKEIHRFIQHSQYQGCLCNGYSGSHAISSNTVIRREYFTLQLQMD